MATLLPNEEASAADLHGYRIFIFSHDHPHPPHVHVRKGKRFSSWELTPLRCVNRGSFSAWEIKIQSKILTEHLAAIWRSWNAHWERQNAAG